MELFISPFWATLLVSGGIFLVSFKLGRLSNDRNLDRVIAGTIDKLIEDGYIAVRKNSDGDIELIPYKEIVPVDD